MKPFFSNRGELDSLIVQMGGERKKERKELEKQVERISQLSDTNPYLKDVYKESEKYMEQEKRVINEKIEHLEALIDYINSLLESGDVTKENRIDSLKQEKKRIQREITKIKNNRK